MRSMFRDPRNSDQRSGNWAGGILAAAMGLKSATSRRLTCSTLGATLLLLISMLAAQKPADAGYLVINNDEWTLANAGFSACGAASPTTFIRNVTSLFTGDQPGSFLAYSNNFGLNQTSLRNAVQAAGHTWTVTTNLAGGFTLANLQQFDGVFLGGFYDLDHDGVMDFNPADPVGADQQVLIDYLLAGGNVYIMAGTGASGSVNEANFWNPILATARLHFRTNYNGIGGCVQPVGPHPLLQGVGQLYFNNGNTVDDLDLNDPNGQILYSLNGQGMFALGVYGLLPPPSPYTPNTPPVANAGADDSVNENALFTLDGSLSSDPEAAPLTYLWTQTAGPAVTLSSTTAVNPSFIAPYVSSNQVATFTLVVNDGVFDSAPDSVNVTIKQFNNEPIADAGDNGTIKEGATKLLMERRVSTLTAIRSLPISGARLAVRRLLCSMPQPPIRPLKPR